MFFFGFVNAWWPLRNKVMSRPLEEEEERRAWYVCGLNFSSLI